MPHLVYVDRSTICQARCPPSTLNTSKSHLITLRINISYLSTSSIPLTNHSLYINTLLSHYSNPLPTHLPPWLSALRSSPEKLPPLFFPTHHFTWLWPPYLEDSLCFCLSFVCEFQIHYPLKPHWFRPYLHAQSYILRAE